MLIKTRKNKNGVQLYQQVRMLGIGQKCEKIYFEEGTLDSFLGKVTPSDRQERRHPDGNRKMNNRKLHGETFIQLVKAKDGKVYRIEHLTIGALQRKTDLVAFTERVLINKSKWYKAHPEFRRAAK